MCCLPNLPTPIFYLLRHVNGVHLPRSPHESRSPRSGGMGTRLSEETDNRPKPMVEIGGKPILWHIMKIYSVFGLLDFSLRSK